MNEEEYDNIDELIDDLLWREDFKPNKIAPALLCLCQAIKDIQEKLEDLNFRFD